VANKEKTKQKLNQLILDLKSNSESKISSAIVELASIGDLSMIPILIDVMKQQSGTNLQKQVAKLLSDIQISSATEVFIQVPILWESKLDFSEYLADFVEISVSGDYLIALDCLTIMENMLGPFSESQLLEAQLHLKEFAENKVKTDERKNQILSEIALFIKDQNEGVDADLLFD
jgi:hypothetical protein